MPISVLGLDADDTLWHNETFYRLTRQRFNELTSLAELPKWLTEVAGSPR